MKKIFAALIFAALGVAASAQSGHDLKDDGLHGNVKRVDVLPYHALALAKYQQLGIDYPLKDVKSPSPERVANAKKILEAALA